MIIIKLNEKELVDNYDAIVRLLNDVDGETVNINTINANTQNKTVTTQNAQVTPKTNAQKLIDFANAIAPQINEKQKISLKNFVNFYSERVNDWKEDLKIDKLWEKWWANDKINKNK